MKIHFISQDIICLYDCFLSIFIDGKFNTSKGFPILKYLYNKKIKHTQGACVVPFLYSLWLLLVGNQLESHLRFLLLPVSGGGRENSIFSKVNRELSGNFPIFGFIYFWAAFEGFYYYYSLFIIILQLG